MLHLCPCGAPATYNARGKSRARRDHDLCRDCFADAQRDGVRAGKRLLAVAVFPTAVLGDDRSPRARRFATGGRA